MAQHAIFIGYRRDDTVDTAGRIYDALARRFGAKRIFKDVDNLRPGADFGEYIKRILPQCRVVLVLIGPSWIDARDEGGARRLDDPHDWVRIEIETALATPGADVVPVLVNGARLPRAEELPESLRPLLRRHAAVIRRDPDFHDDVARLSKAIAESVKSGMIDLSALGGAKTNASLPRSQASPPRSRSLTFSIAGLAAVAALALVGVFLAPKGFFDGSAPRTVEARSAAPVSFVWSPAVQGNPPSSEVTAEIAPHEGYELVPGSARFTWVRAPEAYQPNAADYWPGCLGASTIAEDTSHRIAFRSYISANSGQQCHANWVITAQEKRIGAAEPGVETATTAPLASARMDGATLRPGQEFDDCNNAGWCPRMIVIPAGSFMMGSPESELRRERNEGPQRRVTIRAFAVGKFEVTFDQWAACVNRGGCARNPNPDDRGWGRGTRPVGMVTWSHAQEYVRWLANETRQSYRLLTEAEWEYAARGGTTTPYWWGDNPNDSCANENLFDQSHQRPDLGPVQCNDGVMFTAPVGRFRPNPFGLFDILGNVGEWTQDCYVESVEHLPTDGSAAEARNCAFRVYRGGDWMDGGHRARSARRWRSEVESMGSLGFRVARNLPEGG